MQGLASFDLAAIDLADEVRESLRDGVEVLLNGGAKDFVGGFVVAAKGVEAVLSRPLSSAMVAVISVRRLVKSVAAASRVRRASSAASVRIWASSLRR